MSYNGRDGWVYAPLIVAANSPGDPSVVGEATTAAAVNLRSGPGEDFEFLKGPMGYANAERTLDVIRAFTEFVMQPEYRNIVVILGVVNEPQAQIQAFLACAAGSSHQPRCHQHPVPSLFGRAVR